MKSRFKTKKLLLLGILLFGFVLALYERPLKRLLNYELKNLMLYEITIQNKEITSFGNLVVWFVCCNMGTKKFP